MRLFIILVLFLCLPFGLPAEAQNRLETILNIETDRRNILQQRQVVRVPFYQVYLAAQNSGSSPDVTVTPFAPIALCGIDAPSSRVPGGIYVRFLVDHNPNVVLLPPQIDNPPFVCEVRIMNVQLQGGWQLDDLENVSPGCSQSGGSVEISRPFNDPSNLTHDITLTLSGTLPVPGGCGVRIGTAVLSGPFGDVWNNAFN